MEQLTMTTRSGLDCDVVQTTPPDDDDETFQATVRIVVPIVFGLVTVVGLVGNLLVVTWHDVVLVLEDRVAVWYTDILAVMVGPESQLTITAVHPCSMLKI